MAGVERAIPLRFYKMYETQAGGLTDADLFESIRESIDVANNAYKAAGIQFYNAGLVNCPDERGASWRGTYADIRTPVPLCADGDRIIGYSEARDDMLCLYPSLSATDPLQGQQSPERWWMHYFIMAGNRPWEIPVLLHQYNGADDGLDGTCATWKAGHYARAPWLGRGVHMHAAMSPHKLSHELGHSLGLKHTFEVVNDAPDPSTGAMFNSWDFWDLFYKPATYPWEEHTFFASATEAQSASPLWTINQRDSGGDNCTVDGTYRIECTWSSAGVTETWRYPDNDPKGALKGLGFTTGTGNGTNLMSYHSGVADRYMLSNSQVRALRKFLRYETSIPSEPGWPSDDGGRTQLGRYVSREPAFKLDFDGDGLRDIAWWTPPTTAAGTGTFSILRSTNGYAAPALNVAFGSLGDVPVPADYDGNGITNLAVYQPGGGINNDPFNNSQSYWRWCADANPPTTTMCNTSTTAQFGTRRDVPLPGLDFDGNATTGHLAIYRPGNPSVWVWGPPADWNPNTDEVRYMGNERAVPLPGLYDTDKKTDLVVYYPDSALFQMRLSSSTWNTAVDRQFPQTSPSDLIAHDPPGSTAAQRSGAIPVRGMYKRVWTGIVGCGGFLCNWYEPRLALSLWSPHDGMWQTMWSPVSSTNRIWCQAWGSNDIPLAGLGLDHRNGISGTAYSRHSVYSAPPHSWPGYLYSRPSAETSCPAQDTSISYYWGGPKTMVFTVADMRTPGAPSGDGKPEILMINPDTMVARYVTSDSGYLTAYVLGTLGNQNAIIL